MAVIIGSARIDERGRLSGGAKGDQKQTSTPDFKGEVSMQEFYVSSKGWYVLRPKSPIIARKIAKNMKRACNNPNIGYDQAGRYGIMSAGTDTKVKTAADCSSLIRKCILEASGVDVGDFTTASEPSVLENSGLFYKREGYGTGTILYTGDVLVTKRKGHTVAVVEGSPRGQVVKESDRKTVAEIALEVLDNRWGSGYDRQLKLMDAGYDYEAIQKKVNDFVANPDKKEKAEANEKPKKKKTTAVVKEEPKKKKSEPKKKATTLNTIAASYKTGKVYTVQVDALNVRRSANGEKLSKSQLSANAKKHANANGQLIKGTSVTCKSTKVADKKVWIKIPSGWICAYNGSEYYVK